MSLLDPFLCGFGKVALLYASSKEYDRNGKKSKQEISRIKQEKFEVYLKQFEELPSYQIEYKTLAKQSNKLTDQLQYLGKHNCKVKNEILQTFHCNKWNELNSEDRNKHTLYNCTACFSNTSYKALLTSLSANKYNNKKSNKKNNQSEKKALVDKTKQIVNELNSQYHTDHNTTFETVYNNYTNKNQKQTRKKEDEELIKKVVDNIQVQWKKTDVPR